MSLSPPPPPVVKDDDSRLCSCDTLMDDEVAAGVEVTGFSWTASSLSAVGLESRELRRRPAVVVVTYSANSWPSVSESERDTSSWDQ
jgi:hypothetical protein